MGSFDNIEIGFKCPFCGEEVELQTKDGPRIFESFKIGDTFWSYDEYNNRKPPSTRIINAYGDCPHRRKYDESQILEGCTCFTNTFYIWFEVFILVENDIITDVMRFIHRFRNGEWGCLSPSIVSPDAVDKFNSMKIAKEIEIWGRELEPERLAKS